MYNFLIGKPLSFAKKYFEDRGLDYSVVMVGACPDNDAELVVKVGESNAIYVCGFLINIK